MSRSDALPDLSILMEISGLESMRGILEGRLPPPPIAETLKLKLTAVADGKLYATGTTTCLVCTI